MGYVVYLLQSPTSTYIGMTNNKERRLKQHNGGLKGGARRTRRGGPWTMRCYVDGLRTKIEALQLEWALQKPHKSLLVREVMGKRPTNIRSCEKKVELMQVVVGHTLAREKWGHDLRLVYM